MHHRAYQRNNGALFSICRASLTGNTLWTLLLCPRDSDYANDPAVSLRQPHSRIHSFSNVTCTTRSLSPPHCFNRFILRRHLLSDRFIIQWRVVVPFKLQNALVLWKLLFKTRFNIQILQLKGN